MKFVLLACLALFFFLGTSIHARGATYAPCETWGTDFTKSLQDAQALRKQGKKLTNRQLYELGRAYIRRKYEEHLIDIETKGLQAGSHELVRKQVYKFFNYCNPLNLNLAPDMPVFDAPVGVNQALLKRWRGLYGQAINDAASMFEYGDKMYGPQIYELGRAMFLFKLHSSTPSPDDAEFNQEQWELLRCAFHILSYLNSPGGPDLAYAPDFVPNSNPTQNKKKQWVETERFLQKNRDALGLGDGIISFLLGSPSAWVATSQRILEPSTPYAILALATRANTVLAKAAGAYTDIKNEEAVLDESAQVFANFVSGDAYAPFLPPAIRVHFLRTAGTVDEPAPQRMALNMTGFENNARLYGLEGWQGIARKFQNTQKATSQTLGDFAKYLNDEYVLLRPPVLGNAANESLVSFLKGAEAETRLGGFFSAPSIFSLW